MKTDGPMGKIRDGDGDGEKVGDCENRFTTLSSLPLPSHHRPYTTPHQLEQHTMAHTADDLMVFTEYGFQDLSRGSAGLIPPGCLTDQERRTGVLALLAYSKDTEYMLGSLMMDQAERQLRMETHLAVDDIKEYTHGPRMCPFVRQELEMRRTDAEKRVFHLQERRYRMLKIRNSLFNGMKQYTQHDASVFDEQDGDWVTHQRHLRMVKEAAPMSEERITRREGLRKHYEIPPAPQYGRDIWKLELAEIKREAQAQRAQAQETQEPRQPNTAPSRPITPVPQTEHRSSQTHAQEHTANHTTTQPSASAMPPSSGTRSPSAKRAHSAGPESDEKRIPAPTPSTNKGKGKAVDTTQTRAPTPPVSGPSDSNKRRKTLPSPSPPTESAYLWTQKEKETGDLKTLLDQIAHQELQRAVRENTLYKHHFNEYDPADPYSLCPHKREARLLETVQWLEKEEMVDPNPHNVFSEKWAKHVCSTYNNPQPPGPTEPASDPYHRQAWTEFNLSDPAVRWKDGRIAIDRVYDWVKGKRWLYVSDEFRGWHDEGSWQAPVEIEDDDEEESVVREEPAASQSVYEDAEESHFGSAEYEDE